MPLATYELNPPKDIQEGEQKDADRAEKFLKSRLKKLSDSQVQQIERDLDKKIAAWKKETNTQRRRLVRYQNLLEGVIQETNFPFEGSSNLTTREATGRARSLKATFNKTAYQDEILCAPVPGPDSKLSPTELDQLQEGFNLYFSRQCNGLRTLKESTIPCARDGTRVITGYWDRRIEKAFDQRTYRNIDEFKKDYPEPKDAGISDDEYANILDEFLLEENPEVIVTFDYDFVSKDQPEFEGVPFAKFVRYPTFSSSLDRMDLYGTESTSAKEELKIESKRKLIYEKGWEKLKKFTGGANESDSWDKAMGFIEGLSMPDGKSDQPVNIVRAVYRYDLDGDGIPERYWVRFAPNAKALLAMEPYRIRRGVHQSVPFRLVSREGRFDGDSLVGDGEDIFNAIDSLHRHRNNVRILSTSPVFIADQNLKENLDLGRAENVIRPGLTLWVPTASVGTGIKQLPIQDLSTNGDSLDEEQLLGQKLDLLWGPAQIQSGMQQNNDPKQPARKAQLMLMQANGRTDDVMDEFMLSLPALYELLAAFLYQYSDGKEVSVHGNGKKLSFPVQWLADPGLKWAPRRRSVQLTPEFAMSRLAALEQTYLQIRPLLMTGDPVALEMWKRQVLNSGEPQAEQLLLEPEKIPQLMKAAKAQSEQAASAQNAMKARGKGQETLAKELAKHGAKVMTGQHQLGAGGMNGA